MELLSHVVIIFLVLWGIWTLFSTVAGLIYILTYTPFLHILANICHLWSFLMMVILICMRWHFNIVLIYISLIISNTEHFFIYLFANYMSLEKCFFMSIACFSKGFFYIDCMDCFYMMTINPFICLVICKYLVSFSRLSFHFVNAFICCVKTF